MNKDPNDLLKVLDSAVEFDQHWSKFINDLMPECKIPEIEPIDDKCKHDKVTDLECDDCGMDWE